MYNVSVITMIHVFDGIIGHNIGHNRSKTVAMSNSMFGRKIGIIRWCLVIATFNSRIFEVIILVIIAGRNQNLGINV